MIFITIIIIMVSMASRVSKLSSEACSLPTKNWFTLESVLPLQSVQTLSVQLSNYFDGKLFSEKVFEV